MGTIKIIGDEDQKWDLDPESDSAIETRLLGAEDVYWDADGTGDVNSFTDRTGAERQITGINSGKIPVQQAVRMQLPGAKNVSDALIKLAERTGSSSSYTILDEDTEVILSADLTHEQKQALINEQIRNLGGHELKFTFPESLNLTISSSFVFSGFHNGKLVVNLNEVELSDAVDTTSLLLVQDCACHIVVTGGTLKHTASSYGVKAVRCPHVYLKDLNFIGSGLAASYALFAEDSDGYAEDCVFSSDQQVLTSGFLASFPVAAHDTSGSPHSGVLAPLASPALTGTPTAPTPDGASNDTTVATTAFVKTAAGSAVSGHNTSGSPHSGVLAPLASPAFSGTPTAPTPNGASNDTTVATTAFVQTVSAWDASHTVSEHNTSGSPHSGVLAPLASPAFSGTPTAPTPNGASNDTTVATTAFVQTAASGVASAAGNAISAHNASGNPHSGVLTHMNEFNTHISGLNQHRGLVPAGVVFPFAGNGSVPMGFLLCDGQAVSRAGYYDLFLAIGILYGAGDGSTTFNVPDFRGQFLRGYKSGLSAEIGQRQGESLPIRHVYVKDISGSSDTLSHYPVSGDTHSWGEDQNPSPHVTPTNYAVQWIIKY